ncbi:hypothetical protein HX137_29235 [Pseudomonas sp. 165]|uniref:Uncharacterized protein n=1 Tax=Pseudomonas juntendi TaxID=2666183 RepID=A0AAJ5V477_9PSED|nr:MULTISPECIES: hypothetical protein [Pseudomonas]MDM1714708.1 hypothetical protein [Pseudomonas sp. 165]WEA23701.1 hypothetical protein PWA60_27255 [Pseudomonas juntendi]
MQLKNLVFTLRQYLAEEAVTKPSVGHTYELLASLMGYDTFASLSSQAFLIPLRGSHSDVVENIRILLAGHPDRQATAKRHEALGATGDAWTVAGSLEAFAKEYELVAVPFQTLIANQSGTGEDTWSLFAFDELMKGLVTISQDQLELALSMLEEACSRELRLRPPLIRLYLLLQECFDYDAGLSSAFKERVELHKRAHLAAGMPNDCSLPPIDPWCPAYGSAHGVAIYSPELNRGLAAAAIIKSILPHDPHTIWVTHNGTLNHLAALGFTNVSLALTHISETHRVCLNPFVASGGNIGLEDRMAIATTLHLMMSSVAPDFCAEHPQLLHVLQEALYDFYRDRERYAVSREPTMRDFIASLDDFVWRGLEGSEISLALAPFCGGGRYAGLFDGNFDLGIESDWVLFDTKALEGTPALAPAILILALKIDAECRHRIPRSAKKALVLGHDWVGHSVTGFTVPFSQLYKSFRRYNLGALVLCQSLPEYLSLEAEHPDSGMADGLLANTSHVFTLISKAHGQILEHSPFLYERPI